MKLGVGQEQVASATKKTSRRLPFGRDLLLSDARLIPAWYDQNANVNNGAGVGASVQVGNGWDGASASTLQPNNTPTLPSVGPMYLPLVWR